MGNRRRHKRVSFLKEMEISCLSKSCLDREMVKALAVNISRSGLVVYCSQPIVVGCEVSINLPLADEYHVDRTEVIIGDVCWTKSLENFYAVGIQFRSLNEHDHFMLLAYLNCAEAFEVPCISE